ncbi:alpha/beta fold hydrolase [Kitasatospora sp. DSM 101779]|uniref:alpha/beta fold hydrolase n=1 Tax=Kitasatospora sp. DSM 101779 TaxID=2853165 RepID=UPI0021DA10F0|nr:alpha/beta hydrolase [Kitasatospora sp. DSM 101779]MCU7820562.1 alpha/beta fold hydrolase [Kitasatospora sp. DSM 101779]
MPVLTSADGTRIAYECGGRGPALVLVDGALCHRSARPLAALLERDFTVYAYDRRGRGESGDTAPYAVDREIEDLRAVVTAAGGRAAVHGISSGAALVLRTAAAEPGITRISLYEPPFVGEAGRAAEAKEYSVRLQELLAAGRRGDAVALFMAHVGVPAQAVTGMRAQPHWSAFEAIAPTLAYDDAVLADGSVPRDPARRVGVPALVLAGGASPPELRQAARAAAEALPGAAYRTLAGQTHDVAAEALAPVLAEFFLG